MWEVNIWKSNINIHETVENNKIFSLILFSLPGKRRLILEWQAIVFLAFPYLFTCATAKHYYL